MALSILHDVSKVSTDIELNYRRYLVKVVMILALPILGGFAVYDIYIQRYLPALIIILMFATILILNWLVKKPIRKSKEDLYYQYYFTFFFAIFGLYLAYSIGFEGRLSRIPWAYAFPVVVFFALGEKKALLWVILLVTGMVFLGMQFSSKEHIVAQELKLRFYISFSFIVLFSYLFERLRRKYQCYLIENQKRLEESENRYREAYENLNNEMKERKRAEAAMRQSEKKYKNLFNNAQVGIFMSSIKDGRLIEANPRNAEISGWDNVDEFLDEWVASERYVDPGTRERLLNELYQKGEVKNFEARFLRKDNTIFWARMSARINQQEGYFEGVVQDITEEKEALETLRQSEARLKEAQKIAHVGDWDLNVETGKASWSEELRHIMGIGPTVVAGPKKLLSLVHPSDKNLVERAMKDALQKDTPYDVQYRLIRQDGDERIIHSRARVVRSDDGRPLQMVGVAQDMTDQMRIQADLKEACDIINKSPAVAFLWKNQEGWPVELVTDNVKELFGYTAEELLSGAVPYSETVHPDDLNRVAGEVSRYSSEAARERFTHIPYRILCKNGEVKWVDDRTFIRRDEDGNITHFQGIVLDITSSKEAEQALRESEEKFRNLSEKSPNMIFINKQGEVVYANKRCEEMLGYEREKFYSPDFDFISLIAPESMDLIKRILKKHMAGEDVEPYEYSIINKDGQRIEVINTTKLIDFQGEQAILGIVTDITERKLLERERESLIAELEAKNAELERFTYTVSHDLKSPLITIRGFLGLVEKDLAKGDTDKLTKDIKRISNAADQMRTLMDELLALSRIGRLVHPPESIAPAELARESLESLAGIIHDNGVKVSISPDLPVIFGDRIRLLEVYQNIIENAVKFTGAQPQPRIEIGDRQDDGITVFYIKDNGLGIDPRYREKIFNLFEKLDSEAEGTGVGLALAKRIIELHGGRIWVESEGPGKGSTFCFTLQTEG